MGVALKLEIDFLTGTNLHTLDLMIQELIDIVCLCLPRLHLWGHSHNSYGIRKPGEVDRDQKLEALSVCAPTMNGTFQLAHHPVVIDIHAPRHDDEAKTGATVGNYRVGLLNATSEPNQFR